MATAFLGLGDGEEDDQQGHAHAVVEAALDVEALADAGGQPWVGDHRQPQRRVGWSQDGGQGGGLPQVQLRKERQAGQGTSHDRERQPDPEQASRNQGLAPEPAEVHPDGVTEQHQGQGGFGKLAHELVGGIGLRLRRAEAPLDLRSEIVAVEVRVFGV